MKLKKVEKEILLTAARQSLLSLFDEVKVNEPDFEEYPELKVTNGAFVTLTIGGKLRGCIGYIETENTLFETVCDAAIQAATSDPRFHPLEQNELEKLELEISVMSVPYPMKSYDEIEVGKHGLILEEPGRRALLLPQVPIEHDMDRDGFLSALCEKAGMFPDYWKENKLNIKLFTAIVFSEEEGE